MIRSLRTIALLVVICHRVAAQETPDLSYLLDAKPELVSADELRQYALDTERAYQRDHQVNGIIWDAMVERTTDRVPTLYGSGGDSALFTGYYLAAASFRLSVTRSENDIAPILGALRGLHILTHISGTPGVLARCAFPAADAARWEYPERWERRIGIGYIYTSAADASRDILEPSRHYPPMVFYTRITRDQLTGVFFGLAVAWAELDPEHFSNRPGLQSQLAQAREIVAEITRALWAHLERNNFQIVDHTGRIGSKHSREVTGILRLQLAALYRAVLADSGDAEFEGIDRFYARTYRKVFRFGARGSWPDFVNRFNNLDQYYAWNLRFARSFSVWLLEDDPARRATVSKYLHKRLWKPVRSHRNTFFNFLHGATQESAELQLADAIHGLQALTLRPRRAWPSPLAGQKLRPNFLRLLFCDVSEDIVPAHLHRPAQYFVWEKDPFAVGRNIEPLERSIVPGLDFLLPYWLGRRYGFVPAAGPL